jgi:FMN-dependent NADH-azoreductase
MKLLHIDSSIQTTGSISREMSRATVERLRREIPNIEVQYKDFAAQPLPHLTAAFFAAHVQDADISGFCQAAVDDVVESRKAMDEFLAADILVLGVPLYNYSVPSSLKAWIDRIVVAGKTFTYGGGDGPVGLAAGKRVIVLLARGGIFSEGSPTAHNEHAETYLRSVFGLVGVDNVEFVVAEGIAIDADHRAAALRNALQTMEALSS